jgi:hypothetical protein
MLPLTPGSRVGRPALRGIDADRAWRVRCKLKNLGSITVRARNTENDKMNQEVRSRFFLTLAGLPNAMGWKLNRKVTSGRPPSLLANKREPTPVLVEVIANVIKRLTKHLVRVDGYLAGPPSESSAVMF